MADFSPHGLVIDRFHGPRFGPLVDGSDRADFFPDAGGGPGSEVEREREKRSGGDLSFADEA
jgi:hypothetical protein